MSTLLQPALAAALILTATEYGLLGRAQAIERLAGPWRPARTLARLAAWFAIGLLGGLWRSPLGWTALLTAVVVTELGALFLHRRVRHDAGRAAPHARPWTHLLPMAAALMVSLAAQLVSGLLRLPAFVWYPPQLDRLAAGAAGLVLLGTWGTLLTVSVIEVTRPNQVSDNTGPRPGPGEMIGLLERALVFLLILAGSLPSVGFIVAFKSAARFPQFKDPDFAEYFLIGTLTSVGLAALAGLAVQLVP